MESFSQMPLRRTISLGVGVGTCQQSEITRRQLTRGLDEPARRREMSLPSNPPRRDLIDASIATGGFIEATITVVRPDACGMDRNGARRIPRI